MVLMMHGGGNYAEPKKEEWISGDVKPTKEGEIAVCITKWGNIVLGKVISYRGELIWERT